MKEIHGTNGSNSVLNRIEKPSSLFLSIFGSLFLSLFFCLSLYFLCFLLLFVLDFSPGSAEEEGHMEGLYGGELGRLSLGRPSPPPLAPFGPTWTNFWPSSGQPWPLAPVGPDLAGPWLAQWADPGLVNKVDLDLIKYVDFDQVKG